RPHKGRRCSEVILESQLNVSWCTYRACDRAEAGRIRHDTGRGAEIRMVQRVEEIGAQVEILALGDVELLFDGEVQIVERRCALGALSGIAELSRRRHSVSASAGVFTGVLAKRVVVAEPVIDVLVIVSELAKPVGAARSSHQLVADVARL